MTSNDLDNYTAEEESEASPPLSPFQHLYQSPAAAAVAPPPPARLPAASTTDDDEQQGPRFKDQARPDFLQPATVPSAIREEPTIPLACALLVPESQIEREEQVQSEFERQLDLEHRQLELESQRLELVERQQQLHQNEQSVSKKWWIGGVVVVAVVLVAGVAGFCVSGNCRSGSSTDITSQPISPMAMAPVSSTTTTTTDVPSVPVSVSTPSPSTTTVVTTTTTPTDALMPTLRPILPPTARPQPVPMPTLRPMPSPVTAQPPQPAPTVAVTPTASTTSSHANSIRSFVNSITLSGRSLQYPSSASAEDRALQWLIDVDRGTSESNMIALRQRYALATIWFQTTTGFGSSGWATGITECDWYGVDCDDEGHLVTSLNLDFNGIDGHIPADLGLLTALTHLGLGLNVLTGTIPSSIASLTALTDLYLSGNALNGTIPTTITSLTDLNYFLVYNNGLTGTMPFCNSVSNQSFIGLVADCGTVSCPCCTHCCPTTRDGIPVFGLC